MIASRPAVVLRAPDGSSVRIDVFPVVLGRSRDGAPMQPDCDLGALDPEGRISRQHAAIDVRGSRLVITDLGSSNGTLLDGRRLAPHEPAELPVHARLVLGRLGLEVEVEFPAPAAAAAVPPAPSPSPPVAPGGPMTQQTPAPPVAAPNPQLAAQAAQAQLAAQRQQQAAAAAQQGAAARVAVDGFLQGLMAALADPQTTHLVVEPHRKVRLCRGGVWVEVGERQVSRDAWPAFWQAFARLARIDPGTGGYVTALLGDTLVAEAVLPPLAVEPILMVEKRPAFIGLDRMAAAGICDAAQVAALRAALSGGILVAGPRGSGRTLLLEALVDEMPRGDRIAVVERRAGIRFTSPRAMRLRSAQGMGEPAVAAAMAVGPDRIVVDDAEPPALAAAAWRAAGSAVAAVVAVRSEAGVARDQAQAVLAPLAGGGEAARRRLDTAFPVTVRLEVDGGRFRIAGVG